MEGQDIDRVLRLIVDQEEKFHYTKNSFNNSFNKKKKNKKKKKKSPNTQDEKTTKVEGTGKQHKSNGQQGAVDAAGAIGDAWEGAKTQNASAHAKTYSEKEMKTLLCLIHDVALEESYMGIYSKYTGRPDNAVLIENKTYVLGEIKHGDYVTANALYQLSQYLLLELYWLRAILHSRAEEVYGFFMMGPKCKDVDDDEYLVGFVRMQVPTVLGQEINISYWLSQHKLNDLLGYKYVYNFLKSGKRFDWFAGKPPANQKVQPSLLYVPNALLSLCQKQTDIELISNGTNAIVLRAKSVDGVRSLFDQTAKSGEPTSASQGEASPSKRRPGSASAQRKKYYEQIDSLGKHCGPFYVKVRTINMSCNWSPKQAALFLNTTRETVGDALTRLFPIPTFASLKMMFMVMNDLGERPSKDLLQDLETTIALFSQLSKRMLAIASEGFYHGDAIGHNCLFRRKGRESFLELVDFDEGGCEIPERDAGSLPENIEFRHCRYPDNIGLYYSDGEPEEKFFLYTVVQLSVLFIQLCSLFEGTDKNEKVQAVYRALVEVESWLSKKPCDRSAFKKSLMNLHEALPVAE